MPGRRRVLLFCTGNSCRSRMVVDTLRQFAGEQFESLSAVAKPWGYVHPLVIAAMQELKSDNSLQDSKHINHFLPPQGTPPDLIISVCSSVEKECPLFPGDVERWHRPFNDPADATSTIEEKLVEFRRVRDEIRTRINNELVG